MPWFAIGLMASQLIGGMVTSTTSGKKIAKQKCENQQLINSYQNSLNGINKTIEQLSTDKEAITNHFQENKDEIEKQQKDISYQSGLVVMKAQDIQNELYRISIIFSILFGTLFIVLLIKFIRRQYIVFGCPYAYTKFKNTKKK